MQPAQPQAEAAGASHEEAPPKQVALAMERLSHAGRLIADIRLGGDRLLEALSVAAQPHRSNKPLNFIMEEEASMRKLLQELRDVGKQLEESGVLSGSLRSRSNSWGLHMPLVCPDGAVVAYAWKRQLAGQAGASAVDRTRLALKAFTDQKRRFFPHLDIESSAQISGGESGISKRHCSPQASGTSNNEELIELTTLSGVLTRLEKEVPTVKINTYQRLDWLKRASLLSLLSNEATLETSSKDNVHNSNRLLTGPLGTAPVAQAAVIELLVPSVFRAIVSLHPAGSTEPDAVAFFSPDEGGNYVHARGFSVYHVFRQITEHAVKALQYFVATKPDTGLYLLLQWVCSYQTLFSKACGKCHRLLTIDRPSALLLPPVHRPFRYPTALKILSNQSTQSTRDHSLSLTEACHIGCSLEES